MNKPPPVPVQRLPRLTSGKAFWRLPLTDYALHELARIVVIDEPGDRETPLGELMSLEPALAVWATCVADRWSVVPRCVLDLARWLSRHLLTVLTWSDGMGSSPENSRDMRARWRELAANSIAVAGLAADQVTDDAVAAETFLFGLLHNIGDWLRSCGPRISLAKADYGCAPSWLVALLHQRSRSPRSEPVQRVVRAIQIWREAGRRGAHVTGVDLSDVAVARRRWRVTREAPETIRGFLPALTQKLRRLDQLEGQFEQTLEFEKLDALGELAYGASHEINNPLINISTRAQAMLSGETDPERCRMLGIINTQAFRANEMIADMMLFARPPELVYQSVDLVSVADSVVAELLEEAREQGTLLRRGGATQELVIEADATQLAVALRAICVNALEAISAAGLTRGEVDVEVEEVSEAIADVPHCARIAVRDSGPGIPPESRRHLFDPFYSGREAGRGLGLGLSKCWRVVTAHGGRIDVASDARAGSTFTILLPVKPADRHRDQCSGDVVERTT